MQQNTINKIVARKSRSVYTLYSVVLSLVVFMIISFLPSAVKGVENNPPTVDSVTIATASGGPSASDINLTESGIKTIYIHGTATDMDGCSQIDDVATPSLWKVAFYRTNVAGGENCNESNLNCYQDTELNANLANCTGGGDVDILYEMDIPIQYYADATDSGSSPDYSATNWTAYVGVSDDNGAIGTRTTTTEINTLKAIETTNSINYGSIGFSGTSPEQTIVITNTGNDNDLDPLIRQDADWTCTAGTIATGAVHWNNVSGQGYASGTAMTTGDVDLNNLSAQKSSDGSASNTNIYTLLQMPATGIGGTCSSALIFTAA